MKPIDILLMCKPASPPRVSLDFKNAVYAINGVSKTLAEVVEENTDWGSFNAADVIAGVGLRATLSTAGFAFLATSPVLTSAAYSAVTVGGVDPGFTAVATYSVSITGNGTASVFCELNELPGFSSGWGWQGARSSSTAKPLYDYDAISFGTALAANGAHKSAFTLSSTRLAHSVDGGSAQVSSAPQANLANTIALTASANIEVGSNGPVTATLERIDFYAPAADGDLHGLSA